MRVLRICRHWNQMPFQNTTNSPIERSKSVSSRLDCDITAYYSSPFPSTVSSNSISTNKQGLLCLAINQLQLNSVGLEAHGSELHLKLASLHLLFLRQSHLLLNLPLQSLLLHLLARVTLSLRFLASSCRVSTFLVASLYWLRTRVFSLESFSFTRLSESICTT